MDIVGVQVGYWFGMEILLCGGYVCNEVFWYVGEVEIGFDVGEEVWVGFDFQGCMWLDIVFCQLVVDLVVVVVSVVEYIEFEVGEVFGSGCWQVGGSDL